MIKPISVGVVGLRFGGEFPPIYRDHPQVSSVMVCDCDEELLAAYAKRFRFGKVISDYDKLLESDIDAVHIVTGIPNHAELVLKALSAGKHVACTVPMATSLDDMHAIVEAQRASGKCYMMMETAIYTYQCLYAKQLIDEGKLGRIQYLRGTHFQDMEGWPSYWMGLPPLHYATHAVAPLLHLSGTYATRVVCRGSGVMRPELHAQYGNAFPIEHALIELNKPEIMAEITRSLFHTAIGYVEGFTVLGENMSFQWDIEDEPPYVSSVRTGDAGDLPGTYGRGRDIALSRAQCPNREELLPEPIRKYTRQHTILDPDNPHISIKQGGGHHGSHPHMIHEYVRCVTEGLSPITDAVTAARWTAVGVCAHQSALMGGMPVDVPSFE